VDSAYVSAIAALCGSAIGALASLATTWLTHRHQDESRRRAEENARLARIFEEFIDSSSKAFLDALVQTSMENPSKVIPLYATMGKLRLFASERTFEAAEKVMSRVVETYYAPKVDLHTRPAIDRNLDVLREFVETCRAELRRYPGSETSLMDKGRQY
jgi:hypothetical protein